MFDKFEVLSWQQVLNDRRVRRGMLQVKTQGRVYEGRIQCLGEDPQKVWFTAALLPCVGGAEQDGSCLLPHVVVSKDATICYRRDRVLYFRALLGEVQIFPEDYGKLEVEPQYAMGGELIVK